MQETTTYRVGQTGHLLRIWVRYGRGDKTLLTTGDLRLGGISGALGWSACVLPAENRHHWRPSLICARPLAMIFGRAERECRRPVRATR